MKQNIKKIFNILFPKRRDVLLMSVLFIGFCVLITSDVGATEKAEGLFKVGDMGSASLKMLGSLVLIIGLIIGLFFILKRFKLSPLSFNKLTQMRIMGTLALAPKRSVAVVEVCGQWLVLGVGTESVTLITKLDKAPEANGEDPVLRSGGSFHTMLKRNIFKNRKEDILDRSKDV